MSCLYSQLKCGSSSMPSSICDTSLQADDPSSTIVEDSDSGLEYYSDSLSSLFDVHSPASGSPGELTSWTYQGITTRYRIPNHTGTSTKLFAHYQWDAGIELCKELIQAYLSGDESCPFLTHHADNILELGAGTGLPSLVYSKLNDKNKKNIVITDYPDQGILDTLKENVRLNQAECPTNSLSVQGLKWGDESQEQEVLRLSLQGYDVIIICDTLWVSSSHPLLIHSLLALLSKQSPHARIFLSAGFHTGRPCIQRFFDMCKQGTISESESGALGRLIPDENVQFGGIWEKNVISGEIREWQEDDLSMGDIQERAKWCVMAILKRSD
ncbi:unnamed protein product [Sympodiomycopsis kandeliae]